MSPLDRKRSRLNPRALNRRALRSLHDAEVDVLMAAQRLARRQAVRAVDAALFARHGAAIALVAARFADRRASAGSLNQAGRDAILRQIAAEEAQELARLTLEHAAERRAMRSSALLGLITAQRAERRMMRRRNRWQRVIAAVVLQPAVHAPPATKRRTEPRATFGRVTSRFGTRKH